MTSFILNKDVIKTDAPTGTVLLDFIRDFQSLKGTKEGCREGDCGACLVLQGRTKDSKLKYHCVNSCMVPIGDVQGCHIVTIEGIDTGTCNPLQQDFVDEGATQCGYCTPGFILAEMAYLLNANNFDPNQAIAAMDGNICRCTGYQSIKRSIEKTLKKINMAKPERINQLVKNGFLPEYFKEIPDQISQIHASNIKKTIHPEIKVAGGTDLYVQKEPFISDKNIQLLFNKAALHGITEQNEQISVKAGSTVTEFIESAVIQHHFPNMAALLKLHSSTPIRNRATMAGNIVNASPIADMTIILLALNSQLVIKNKTQKRWVALQSFYKGYKKFDLSADEIIEEIIFKKPIKNSAFNFEKVSRRTYLDIASVNSAVYLEIENDTIKKATLSAGGVAPVPLFLKESSAKLSGQLINPDTIKTGIKLALREIRPISDMRGSLEYKKLLLRQLLIAHFVTIFPQQLSAEDLL